MPEGRRTRGVTARPRSGAAAESTRLPWCRDGREELPGVRGQEGWPRGVIPCPTSGAAAESTRLPRSKNGQEELTGVRGQGRQQEELPHVRGQGW